MRKLQTGELDAYTGLVLLRNGRPPDHTDQELREIRSDLERAAAGSSLAWLPESLESSASAWLTQLPAISQP